MKFKTRQGIYIDNITDYVHDWIRDKPDIKILIGCDSQVKNATIDYAVSICLYNPGKGGHVISSKTSIPKIKNISMIERLWAEVNKSIEVADLLKPLNKEITIHVDYNSKENEPSNQLYESGIGYAKSLGYKAEGKPNSHVATHVADNAVRK